MIRKLALACIVAAGTFAAHAGGLQRTTVEAPDGVNLSVVESGNPDGPALLFVHGFSQSAASWRHQLESDLGDTFRLIALDLRGHGYSAKPEDPARYVASKLWADDIASVVAAKGLDGFVLVGWSLWRIAAARLCEGSRSGQAFRDGLCRDGIQS